jgi:hypothetical protein
VSYLEIYQVRPTPAYSTCSPAQQKHGRVDACLQECIRDLFKPEDTDLKIHEHPDHGFYVKSTEVVVSSEEQILQLMDSGEAHRHVGQTNMNEKSSRSHTIFRIIIESKLEICDDEVRAGACSASGCGVTGFRS